jgi:tRNA U34 5-methylaminomethyl-2-thiouridine-forming methyltransferase MnmC
MTRYLSRRIISTEDGSHTLYIADLDEHYHSIHGAIQESQHVFIQSGLELFRGKPKVRIFEVGFGTGLNALLTLDFAVSNNVLVEYHSIEKYPLTEDEYLALNFTTGQFSKHQNVFTLMHTCPWNQKINIGSQFTLFKIMGDLHDAIIETQFDLVYFDAFGPDKLPDLWTMGIFIKMFEALVVGGILVTYSAKGEVRRNLQAAGFKVERIPGPPGKREMIRATKP